MCIMCQTLDPKTSTYDPHVAALDGGDTSGSLTAATRPVYSLDQVADYLTDGFWLARGQQARSFNVETGGTITVNINALDATGKATALQALDAWSAVSGLTFVQSSNAMISFDDNQSGAYNSSSTSGNTIISSSVNVHTSWQAYGEYYLQTFIHEIGHALGLGHGGNYNGSANYSTQAVYANDSWQMSVMSYFSQTENPNVSASFAYLATAQIADILAIQNLYGTPADVQAGDTIYGDNTSLTQHGMGLNTGKAVAIFDSSGTDLIDLSSHSASQRLDLNESFSDIDGKVGNLAIARGAVIENARTGAGNDIVTGNAVNNALSGGAGNDVLSGQGGNDVLTGGAGADTLTGGTGADTFVYSAVADAGDTVTDFNLGAGDKIDLSGLWAALGYTGSDPVGDGMVWLEAASGGSWLKVNAGAALALAFLQGLSASADLSDILDVTTVPVGPDPDAYDSVYALTDNFVLAWNAAASVIRDTNGGTDTLDLSAVTYGCKVTLAAGVTGKVGSKKLTIEAGSVIENLTLGAGRDTGTGNEADNEIDGGAGDDKLYGEDGDDTLTGGTGRDKLYGGTGDDTMTGDAGGDQLHGGDGNDQMSGGDDADTLKGEAGDDTLDGGEGNDKLYGNDGDDVLTGDAGKDKLYGDTGDDEMDGGADDDRLYGDEGNDTLTGGGGNDTLYGDDGDDVMSGGEGNDKLYAGDGNDTLTAGNGTDYLRGDNGDDTMDAGAGDDKLYGGNGDDVMEGGAGNDKLYGQVGDDTLSGGDGLDYLKGDRGNDVIEGGAGDDKIYGDTGLDVLDGGAGDDKIYAGSDDDVVEGGAGNDYLRGDAGNDEVLGGDGDDTIDGGTGNDVIAGGAGADVIKGGSGTDVFVFTSVADAGDTLSDFSLRYGEQISVSGLLGGMAVADAIDAGMFALEASGRDSLLMFDADGAGSGAAVELAFIKSLAATTELTTDWLI